MNDAERVSVDPTFRLIGSEKIWERGAALSSTLDWFETELLMEEAHRTDAAAVRRYRAADCGTAGAWRVNAAGAENK